jgi:hypothetical protein
MRGQVFVDLRNVYEPDTMRARLTSASVSGAENPGARRGDSGTRITSKLETRHRA